MTILGHDREMARFAAAMAGERAPHAWLFAGPEGIGKASLAHRLARDLLVRAADPRIGSDVPEDHPIAKLCDACSHPDQLILERQPKDAKAVRDLDRREWPEGLELVRNISVDQVRALRAACALKPSLSARRVIVIDSIDDLERAAANALLKILEEPPTGTVFLLVSHASGRLLPTIRSRCRVLRFHPLPDDVMTTILRQRVPDGKDQENAAILAHAKGSPGRALALSGLAIGTLAATIDRIMDGGDPSHSERAALMSSLGGKSQARYEAFLELVPRIIARHARSTSGPKLAHCIRSWEDAQMLASSATGSSLDPAAVALRLAGIVAGLAPASASA